MSAYVSIRQHTSAYVSIRQEQRDKLERAKNKKRLSAIVGPPEKKKTRRASCTQTKKNALTRTRWRENSRGPCHTALYVLLYYYRHVCGYVCVVIPLHMCPHASTCVLILRYMCFYTTIDMYAAMCVLLYHYICVLMHLHMCPHTTLYVLLCVVILVYTCPHTDTTSVSSYRCCTRTLWRIHMCLHTDTTYVSSYRCCTRTLRRTKSRVAYTSVHVSSR
jgi:hypothetical protein